jgi:hypothetical protein
LEITLLNKLANLDSDLVEKMFRQLLTFVINLENYVTFRIYDICNQHKNIAKLIVFKIYISDMK